MQFSPKNALALTTLVVLGLAVIRPAAAAVPSTTVYSNNFSAGAGPSWSNQTTSTTPGTVSHAADAFLGEFSNQTDTLSLSGLASHSQVNVTFDLYMIRSMDGNGQFGGSPDPWSLTETGSANTTLITTNFANYPGNTQGFGGSNGSGGYLTGGTYAPQTGAAGTQTLGYTFNGTPMDAVYHLSFTFNDTASALALNFIGQPNEDITNESWGLDNVVVKTDNVPAAVPEASTTVSFGLLLALGMVGVLAAKKKQIVSA